MTAFWARERVNGARGTRMSAEEARRRGDEPVDRLAASLTRERHRRRPTLIAMLETAGFV
jgi:hypothetical protein